MDETTRSLSYLGGVLAFLVLVIVFFVPDKELFLYLLAFTVCMTGAVTGMVALVFYFTLPEGRRSGEKFWKAFLEISYAERNQVIIIVAFMAFFLLLMSLVERYIRYV
jgi:hypothetical protein